ncbi:MAG: hypothetical protein V4693_03145 [Pseudomonadota bacterium]
MGHTISLQYMEAGWEEPRAGYEFTDGEFPVPQNGHVPRVGEFIQLLTPESAKMYQVLAVNTRIAIFPGQEPGWHSYLTVGPADEASDQRLTRIRE